jgi:cytochrome c553
MPTRSPKRRRFAPPATAKTACHRRRPPPAIWGQYQGYLYLQLRDFKLGTRKNDLMSPIAAGLERDDMMALAGYFSQQKWPALRQPQAPADVAARAVRINTSVGCTGCHQNEYQGEGTQPRLAGQYRDYLAKTMLEFRTRTRANNPGMSDLMNAATPDDLNAIADYLAGR